MSKVVRPLRFDNARKAARNAKRRTKERARREKDRARYRPFNNFFWFDEPEIMWDNSPWDDRDPSGGACAHNDNRRVKSPSRN